MPVVFANAFNAITFGWAPGGPSIEKVGGLVDRWSGEIEVETKALYDSLAALMRPVNVRVIAAQTAYVDYWDFGATPIKTLTLKTKVAAGTETTETRQAILSNITRAKLRSDGSVRATAEFHATDLPVP